jgi:hypothetical protein
MAHCKVLARRMMVLAAVAGFGAVASLGAYEAAGAAVSVASSLR